MNTLALDLPVDIRLQKATRVMAVGPKPLSFRPLVGLALFAVIVSASTQILAHLDVVVQSPHSLSSIKVERSLPPLVSNPTPQKVSPTHSFALKAYIPGKKVTFLYLNSDLPLSDRNVLALNFVNFHQKSAENQKRPLSLTVLAHDKKDALAANQEVMTVLKERQVEVGNQGFWDETRDASLTPSQGANGSILFTAQSHSVNQRLLKNVSRDALSQPVWLSPSKEEAVSFSKNENETRLNSRRTSAKELKNQKLKSRVLATPNFGL